MKLTETGYVFYNDDFLTGKTWNNPKGLPVMLVHGLMDNAGTFDNLIPLLPGGFFYVAIDLPDHGKSSHSTPGFLIMIFNYVFAIDRVADHFGWESFTLVGHSVGGFLCYLYSAFFPNRINKLITIEAPFFIYTPENINKGTLHVYRKNNEAETATPTIYSYEEAVQYLRFRTVGAEMRSEKTARNLARRCLIKTSGGYTFSTDKRLKVGNTQRMTKEQVLALFKEIRCPLFQIVAHGSVNAPGALWGNFEVMKSFLKRQLGDKYCLRFVEGDHNVHTDFPERVSNLVSDFLVRRTSSL